MFMVVIVEAIQVELKWWTACNIILFDYIVPERKQLLQ